MPTLIKVHLLWLDPGFDNIFKNGKTQRISSRVVWKNLTQNKLINARWNHRKNPSNWRGVIFFCPNLTTYMYTSSTRPSHRQVACPALRLRIPSITGHVSPRIVSGVSLCQSVINKARSRWSWCGLRSVSYKIPIETNNNRWNTRDILKEWRRFFNIYGDFVRNWSPTISAPTAFQAFQICPY